MARHRAGDQDATPPDAVVCPGRSRDIARRRNSLRAQLDAELDNLSPYAQQDVQSNLDVIHTAIIEINTALEQEPDNVLLQQKLLRAYREELALLRRVGGLTRNVMIRNDI